MNRVTMDPTTPDTDDKPPFFLPNRAAFRRAAKPVKSRLRKSSKWVHRLESSGDDSGVVELFRHLKTEATRDLATLQGARA